VVAALVELQAAEASPFVMSVTRVGVLSTILQDAIYAKQCETEAAYPTESLAGGRSDNRAFVIGLVGSCNLVHQKVWKGSPPGPIRCLVTWPVRLRGSTSWRRVTV